MRRRDPASRQLDFLVQEDEKARSVLSSTRLLGSKRREGEIRQLVNSTSWVQEDEKARSGISSTRLLGSKKVRRRDPAFSSTRLLASKKTRKKAKRRVFRSCQVDFLGPGRREGEFLYSFLCGRIAPLLSSTWLLNNYFQSFEICYYNILS